MSDIMMNLTLPVGDLFIVVDTNIFLSNLDFVAKLLKYKIQRKYLKISTLFL